MKGVVVQMNPKETKVETDLDPEDDLDEIVSSLNELQNWSQRIRYLHTKGFKNRDIAFILGEIRGYAMSPQQVNNVLSRPLKTDPSNTKVGRPKTPLDNRSEKIANLFKSKE